MTIAAWLEMRTPAPPLPLLLRLERALGGALALDAAEIPSEFLAAAESLLLQLVSDGCIGRGRALDLLAVDALVTYAFEAASDQPESLDRRAQDAMTRIAALVARATA